MLIYDFRLLSAPPPMATMGVRQFCFNVYAYLCMINIILDSYYRRHVRGGITYIGLYYVQHASSSAR